MQVDNLCDTVEDFFNNYCPEDEYSSFSPSDLKSLIPVQQGQQEFVSIIVEAMEEADIQHKESNLQNPEEENKEKDWMFGGRSLAQEEDLPPSAFSIGEDEDQSSPAPVSSSSTPNRSPFKVKYCPNKKCSEHMVICRKWRRVDHQVIPLNSVGKPKKKSTYCTKCGTTFRLVCGAGCRNKQSVDFSYS